MGHKSPTAKKEKWMNRDGEVTSRELRIDKNDIPFGDRKPTQKDQRKGWHLSFPGCQSTAEHALILIKKNLFQMCKCTPTPGKFTHWKNAKTRDFAYNRSLDEIQPKLFYMRSSKLTGDSDTPGTGGYEWDPSAHSLPGLR
jgi:hypothetical protein